MEENIVLKEENKKINPKFVLKIVGNVVFYLFILLLLIFSIMNIRGYSGDAGFPNIFGTGILSVQTDSMNGDKEDSFVSGDLIFVKVFNKDDFNDLEVGTVVTFYDQTVNHGQGGLNSHRIVFIQRDAEGKIEILYTQGDLSVKDRNYVFNPTTDKLDEKLINTEMLESNEVQALGIDDIKGVKTGIWRGVGAVLDFVQEYWLVFFVIPVLLFLIFEILMVVKNVMDVRAEQQKAELQKTNEELKADLEAQKEALRAEILAELEAEKEKKESEE